MRIDVLTIFPDLFTGFLTTSIPANAIESGAMSCHVHDIRVYAANRHRKVDDRPFGGGPGMVMMCQPIFDAVQAIELLDSVAPVRVMLSPQGERLTQPRVEWLAQQPHVLLLCGHYEGIDERVVEELAPLELSLGDYVLSGGELGAMVLIDAVARLQPGVLGHEDSAAEDSFSVRAANGAPLLDCPHYTRPREWNGRAVPDVLLNGDHQAISRWRDAQRMERTRTRRPDLLLETTTQTQVQSQVQSHSLETRPLTTDTERTLVQHKSVDQVDRPNRSSLTSENSSADINTHTGLQGHNAPENA
ncbi:MAG: tRNA (guanosine(37)-N1)-methyltransferase TrmD [Planctomycetota bacterium]|nr:MAG: tRNA (guanosine(37)-N1)-methyltransferase TrmD [Planctomycetota bacterium]